MTAKINLRQYVIFTKSRNFNTADIYCYIEWVKLYDCGLSWLSSVTLLPIEGTIIETNVMYNLDSADGVSTQSFKFYVSVDS